MTSLTETVRATLNVLQGCVVATIQIELGTREIEQLQDDILSRIQQTRARGLILDLSGLTLIDSIEFTALQRIVAMAKLLGTDSVLVGLRPGVVATLVESNLDFSRIEAVQTLEDAFSRLDSHFGLCRDQSMNNSA